MQNETFCVFLAPVILTCEITLSPEIFAFVHFLFQFLLKQWTDVQQSFLSSDLIKNKPRLWVIPWSSLYLLSYLQCFPFGLFPQPPSQPWWELFTQTSNISKTSACWIKKLNFGIRLNKTWLIIEMGLGMRIDTFYQCQSYQRFWWSIF